MMITIIDARVIETTMMMIVGSVNVHHARVVGLNLRLERRPEGGVGDEVRELGGVAGVLPEERAGMRREIERESLFICRRGNHAVAARRCRFCCSVGK